MAARVLILCHGNLNRSPAAAAILRRHRPGLEVKSAGVRAETGSPIAKRMRTALETCGYDTSGRSRQVTQEMVDWAELILVMDEKNADRLMEMSWIRTDMDFSEKIQKRVQYVGDLIGVRKIPDPHFAKGIDAHHDVVRMLEKAFQSPTFDQWLEAL